VAGTIGARGFNKTGVIGVCPMAKLMAVKVMNKSGQGGDAVILKGIAYARKMGAKVQNLSIGGSGYNKAMEDEIKEYDKAAGVFVVAAGNSNNDNDASPDYPATYKVPNVISVAASQRDETLTDFSSYGATTVHIAAPGRAIYSTHMNSYTSMDGTSMACPHVAGAAAFVYSHLLRKDPSAAGLNAEVRKRLLDGARKMTTFKKAIENSRHLDVFNSVQ
jgi:thermitase